MSTPDVTVDERLQIFLSGKPGPDEICVGYVRSLILRFRHTDSVLLSCAEVLSPAQLNASIRWEPQKPDETENVFAVSGDSFSKNDSATEGRDIWIGSIPNTFVAGSIESIKKRLLDLFGRFGETETVTLRRKKENDSWALITYAKRDSVLQAEKAGMTLEDGSVLRVREADVRGKIGDGDSNGLLFHMAQHHGLKKLKPGMLHLTVLSGDELTTSPKQIKDLSTYVDYKSVWRSLKILFVYLLVAFVFYNVSRRLSPPCCCLTPLTSDGGGFVGVHGFGHR